MVVAKKLRRNYIGVEKDYKYFNIANSRIQKTSSLDNETVNIKKSKKDLPKVSFGELVEQGIIPPGAILSDANNRFKAKVKVDGSIKIKNHNGSIHQVGASVQGLPACNGWDYWYLNQKKGKMLIDNLRSDYRSKKIN